jgi:uncharacterized membrane protein YedE/YeeE
MEWLQAKWSPYVVGASIGVLSWFAFLLSNRPIGCSTAFVRVVGLVERALLGTKAMEKPYYRKFPPVVDWEVVLLIGLGIGSLTSALVSGTFRVEWVSSLWASSIGTSAGLRWIVALVGGVLVALGARWAGGCTSGHSISGGLQLAASSWLATLCFFAAGVATTMLVHRAF